MQLTMHIKFDMSARNYLYLVQRPKTFGYNPPNLPRKSECALVVSTTAQRRSAACGNQQTDPP